MTTVRKTITLTGQQNDWVKARITSGDFTNDSEYFRDLIRRDQERNAGIAQLRAALVEGEQSGVSERTPDDIRGAARERLKADGRI
ncbi:MAG: type II toxin-antitoxin system ParD family antitoxin [Porticoccaceae bacterium]